MTTTKVHDYECQSDGCEIDAEEIVVTDDDITVLLCAYHYEREAARILGRYLMRDTAGDWFFMPDCTATHDAPSSGHEAGEDDER